MAAQAQYHDQKTGWTWGGVLKGVAYTVGVIAVGCAVYMGGVAAAQALGFKETAAAMVGMSGSTLAGIADIPNAFVKMIGGFLEPVGNLFGDAGQAVQTNVIDPATKMVGQGQKAAADMVGAGQQLVNDYGKPAAAVAGAGAAGYWVGKVKGKSEQKQNFRDMVTKGREQAALDNISRA